MNALTKVTLVLKHLGPRWALFRLRYAVQGKTGGVLRRSPEQCWNDISPKEGGLIPRFFDTPPAVTGGCIAEAEDVLRGTFRLFSFHRVVAGSVPDWHLDQMADVGGRRTENGGRITATVNEFPIANNRDRCATRHWAQIDAFARGDIKCVWELSRFPWAFALGRAYVRTGDNRYAEGFWALFDNWLQHNQPNCGSNWMCGQEATFRLMAATFARDACLRAPATTPARLARFASFVLATGCRIEANLDYALSQSNNHGVSEAIGLLTTAVLLPAEEESARWRKAGLNALEAQLGELVYPDGAFAQHSANYHRILLHDLIWCAVALRAAGEKQPAWLLDAGRRALVFIETVMNPDTGRALLYGANDGANVLPLTDCDYLDFRPLVQAGHAVFHGVRRLPPGPWDEAALWLAPGVLTEDGEPRTEHGGPITDAGGRTTDGEWLTDDGPATNGQGQRTSDYRRHFKDGGCLIWQHREMRAFLRCPTDFRHRPSHADLLHVDIEWQGQQIAIDAGTFSYNAPGAFEGALKEAAVHNTLTFDGREPMAKAGRFLYLPWPQGSIRATDQSFEATHDAWQREGVRHIRRLRALPGDGFEVEDFVSGRNAHSARVHWLLKDFEYQFDFTTSTLRLLTPQGPFDVNWNAPDGSRVTLVRADADSNRGWESPHYWQAAPALSLAIEFEFTGETRFVTQFKPA